jgi:hypothetical protein
MRRDFYAHRVNHLLKRIASRLRAGHPAARGERSRRRNGPTCGWASSIRYVGSKASWSAITWKKSLRSPIAYSCSPLKAGGNEFRRDVSEQQNGGDQGDEHG